MNAHVHAENMRLYAEDAAETDKPWERWEARRNDPDLGVGDWQPMSSKAYWFEEFEYRRKPKTAKVNGYELDVDSFAEMAKLMRYKGWGDLVDAILEGVK